MTRDTASSNEISLAYDPTSADSIIEYAKRLEGKTLREMCDAPDLPDPHTRRGSFGNAIEQYYFGYAINSDSAPDFAEAGLELKTTPMKKRADGQLVAKERLVLTMIDYMHVPMESFEDSHLLDKVADLALISYLYEPDKNPVDYKIQFAERWQIPDSDIPQIKKDWETVVATPRISLAATPCTSKHAQKQRTAPSERRSPSRTNPPNREHGLSRPPI